MVRVDFRRCVMPLVVGSVFLAATVSAEERESKPQSLPHDEVCRIQAVYRAREPRRWNAAFIYGSTVFYGSDAHQTLGVSFRIRLSDRLSVEPEFRYMSLPNESYEWRSGRAEYEHSDIMASAHVVYDLREEAATRFVPYVSGGVGWVQTRDQSTITKMPPQSTILIVPAPSTEVTSETRRTAGGWLWVGGAFGLRFIIHGGFYVSPEVRFGGSNADLSASAVIKLGFGF
jgi:hypothetical protein